MILRYIKSILIIGIPFFILVSLGTWQVLRLQSKNSIIMKMKSPVIMLPKKNLENYSYMNIKTRGVFDRTARLHFFTQGKKYYLLQPLHLENGEYILVNRGTISNTHLDIKDFVSNKEVNINGILYCEQHKKISWVVNNDTKSNIWFWFDIKSMAEYLKLPLKSCIIWANETAITKGIAPNKILTVHNNHLEYIITWYSLAIIWLLGSIYFFYFHRPY